MRRHRNIPSRASPNWVRESLKAMVRPGLKSHWKRYAWSFCLLCLVCIEIFYSRGENIDFLLKSRFEPNPAVNNGVDSMYARISGGEQQENGAIETEGTPSTDLGRSVLSQTAHLKQTPRSLAIIGSEPPPLQAARRERPLVTDKKAFGKAVHNTRPLDVKWEN
jgi:hypothetical protein